MFVRIKNFSILIIILVSNTLFAQTTFDDPRVKKTVNKIQEILNYGLYINDDITERIDKTILKFPDDGNTIINLIERIKNYQRDYVDLTPVCMAYVSSIVDLPNMQTCIWRKDEIILKKYGFHDLLYDYAYSRYDAMHDNAGYYATLMLGGSDYMDQYIETTKQILHDALILEFIYLLEIQEIELTQKNRLVREENISNEPRVIGSGSGFFITNEGHIITNHHVIDKCEKVLLNNESLKVISKDPYNDLAILKSNIQNNKFLYLKKSKIKKGEDVLVIGYPYGKDWGDQSKITKGIVSSLQGLNSDYSRIQIDAAIQPGNSGGPTLDLHGDVMGVTVATASVKAFLEMYDSVPQNMNFSIKSSVVEMMLEANDIKLPIKSQSNNTKKNASEIIKDADPAIVYLECFGKK